MPVNVVISQDQLMLTLGKLGAATADTGGALKVIGGLMIASIARTFQDEGSPAGSWPQLAASTRKKGYTAGHKLLVLSGRLRSSFTYDVQGSSLVVGTNVQYAAVQQFGSADRRGGSVGAQAKIPGREVRVDTFDYMRVLQRENKKQGLKQIRVQTKVKAHTRHQNIPARPFLVFRPEDPGNFVSGVEAWLSNRIKGASA